jgi:antirestriction protein ArdC
MNDKVKSVLDAVVEKFKTGDIPAAITMSMFPFPEIPSSNWSMLNRTAMFISGTMDARGFKQWLSVDRHVRKGSKAVYILVPVFKKVDDSKEDSKILTGFTAKPVFRVEDTDGEPLEYEQIELPELPLLDRAREWGLDVKAIPGNPSRYGYYNPVKMEIGLATPDESTLFHEMAHHADKLIKGKLNKGQDPLQEVTAELAAATLCRLVGKQSDSLGNSYKYIEGYAAKLKMSAHAVCLKVMADTEKILKLILLSDPETTGGLKI